MSDNEVVSTDKTRRRPIVGGVYVRAKRSSHMGIINLGLNRGFVRIFNDELRVGLAFQGDNGETVIAALKLGDASDLAGLVEGQPLQFAVINRDGSILATEVRIDGDLLPATESLTPAKAALSDSEADIPDVRDVAKAMGASPGVSLSGPATREVYGKIVISAVDLFGDRDRSAAALRTMRFGPAEFGILELIKTGQTPRILNHLDEIRFGYQG